MRRPATQSSTKPAFDANKAVDGDINSHSMTNIGDRHPWWKVRLAYPVWVTQVDITNVYKRA